MRWPCHCWTGSATKTLLGSFRVSTCSPTPAVPPASSLVYTWQLRTRAHRVPCRWPPGWPCPGCHRQHLPGTVAGLVSFPSTGSALSCARRQGQAMREASFRSQGGSGAQRSDDLPTVSWLRSESGIQVCLFLAQGIFFPQHLTHKVLAKVSEPDCYN